MKKTLTMLAILLTLCLAASACTSPAKKEKASAQPAQAPVATPAPAAVPAPAEPIFADDKDKAIDERMMQDGIYVNYLNGLTECVVRIVDKHVFDYATTSSLHAKVNEDSIKACRIRAKAFLLRSCELDPRKQCQNGRALEENVDRFVNNIDLLVIEAFDKDRAKQGLPPRPSFDK